VVAVAARVDGCDFFQRFRHLACIIV